MKYIEKDELPVEIKNNELPIDKNKKPEMFYNEKIRTSGGFTDVIFLSAAMIVSFLWGMLAVLMRG